VLDLYARVADGPSSGFTIAAALSAGICGKRLAFAPVDALDEIALPFEEHRQFAAQGQLAGKAGHVGRSDVHAMPLGRRGLVPALDEEVIADLGDDLAELQLGERVGSDLFRRDAAQREPVARLVADGPVIACHQATSISSGRRGRPAGSAPADTSAALILGVDLPGPHAVTVAPDGCWVSWGRHYDPADFPGAVVEEAWAVSFA